eukprot:1161727-Pelagomonas_calceolata.AAC.3
MAAWMRVEVATMHCTLRASRKKLCCGRGSGTAARSLAYYDSIQNNDMLHSNIKQEEAVLRQGLKCSSTKHGLL